MHFFYIFEEKQEKVGKSFCFFLELKQTVKKAIFSVKLLKLFLLLLQF
jgi:hypothetical protein